MFETLGMLENSVVAFGDALTGLASDVQNFQTPGYKGTRANFVSLFNSEMVRVGGSRSQHAGASNQQSTSQGMTYLPMGLDFSQGGLQEASPLNAGVIGNGLFVLKPDNMNDFLYTRASDFSFSADGVLLDSFGRKVMAYKRKNGVTDTSTMVEIKVDINTTSVEDLGFETGGILTTNYTARASAREEGETVPLGEELYQLALADVPNPSGLSMSSGGSYRTSIRSGDVSFFGVATEGRLGDVEGGFLEGSNIDPAEKTIVGIQFQRGYNAVQAMLNLINKTLNSFISIVDKA